MPTPSLETVSTKEDSVDIVAIKPGVIPKSVMYTMVILPMLCRLMPVRKTRTAVM